MNSLFSEPPALTLLVTQLDSLPPHDPERYQTTDGLDEPDATNGWRAEQALVALRCFARENHYPENDDTALPDLLSNLLHLAHARVQEPGGVLTTALRNFLAEAAERETEG